MNLDALRDYCLRFPGATEQVQWGHDLVFKVSGKMFAVACLDPGRTTISFKCTPEDFAELVEVDDIRPADYAARYHWVTLQTANALPARDIKARVAKSYDLVVAKLPRSRRPDAAGRRTART